ncbi:MAG: CHAT domain-containing protein [Spirochaetota bacterium]|nr:CHAT domain-containing protein [Spirochaetota bacterium]
MENKIIDIYDEERISRAKEEAIKLMDMKQWGEAFFLLEKLYYDFGEIDLEIEMLILEPGYRGIWGAYYTEQYELMEYLSRFVIHLLEKGISFINRIQILNKLAKSYNGLAISLYQLGKRNIIFNKKSSKTYDELINILKENKEIEQNITIKEVVKSKLKNDFGLIINLGYDDKFNEAKDFAIKSIKLADDYKLSMEAGLAKKIMGNLLFYHKNYDESFYYLFESAKIFEKQNNKEANRRLGELYLLICENYFKLNEFEKGKEYLDKSNMLFQKVNNFTYKYYDLLGQYFENVKDAKSAINSFLQAISLLNVIKWGVQLESNIDSFLEHRDKELIFLKCISALLEDNKKELSFEIFEKFRSKLFIENMLSGKDESFAGIPLPLKQGRENILKRLAELHSSQTYINDNSEIIRLEKELYYCDEKIASIKNTYKAFSNFHVEPISEYQKLITENTLIVEYFYYNDKLYIFLVGNKLFEVVSVKVSSDQLEELVNGYTNNIKKEFNNPNWNVIEDFYKNNTQKLLVSPIKPYLSNIKEIIIIPYKILHSFPIHHLFLSVYNDIMISYLPNFLSISLLKRDFLSNANILLIGDPRDNLKGSLEEINEISKLFSKPVVFSGKTAHKENILKELSNYPMVHYSGHIKYNLKRPLYSYLETGEVDTNINNTRFYENQNVIFLKEIYKLSIENVKFLSLSGCSSGVSTRYKGEELVGLVRGFFYAGVKSILASLWDIEDQSSKDFLISFFKNTLENGGNKKIGFQKAYQMMKTKYNSPFFYGGFTLYEGI